jgi:hypothetical protein
VLNLNIAQLYDVFTFQSPHSDVREHTDASISVVSQKEQLIAWGLVNGRQNKQPKHKCKRALNFPRSINFKMSFVKLDYSLFI